MAFDVNIVPSELIENFQEGRGAIFVGAGLSIDAGFPSWGGLLNELIDESRKLKWINDDKINQYVDLISDSSKFLFVAEDLKLELGTKFWDYMSERFAEHDKTPTLNHELIVQINSSLLITINYDDLLEQAYTKAYGKYPPKFIYNQSREAANNFWKNRFFILKAHGDASLDVNTLILTQKDYRKTLYRELGYRSLIQAIFTTKSILFVGVSMNDPEFNQLIDYLHDCYHGGGPKHYLLLDESENNSTIARRYSEDFNILTISYQNPLKDYKEITEFLSYVQTSCPAKI
ncbi:SIR2 family protein [Persicitalea jodogahamensis]|uniref:SIR2-like domain-containing protein n=1 Tax=Persicitalea jodogahamensis TaxID=402147 RepID=A0A8J3GAU7_9BACT|nr:SIR2 family protein [Persicitalea jodogahamensis]GHB82826.1 hypothetical protein GCM10007390_42130 [Persicitalea jodogahamensis]